MGSDWGDSYSSRFDQQNYDLNRNLQPRTFNSDGSLLAQPKNVDGSAAPVSDMQPSQSGPNWQQLFSSVQGRSAPDLKSMNPYTDLGYNSFLRGFGLQQNQINSTVARQKAGLEAQLQAQRPAWADSLARGLRNIGGAAEASGVFRSGQRLQNQGEFQVDQSRAQNNYEAGIRGQEGDLQAQAQAQLFDLARQKAEQELSARQRLAADSVQNGTNPMLAEYLNSLINQG